MNKKTREDRIYVAYKAYVNSLKKEAGIDRIHARALLYIAESFNISPLKAQQIVAQRSTKI